MEKEKTTKVRYLNVVIYPEKRQSPQRYCELLSARNRKNVQIIVEPDLTHLPQQFSSLVNGVVIHSFNVTCFFSDRTVCEAFRETNLVLTMPLEEWKVWDEEYKSLVGTLHQPSEFWVNE